MNIEKKDSEEIISHATGLTCSIIGLIVIFKVLSGDNCDNELKQMEDFSDYLLLKSKIYRDHTGQYAGNIEDIESKGYLSKEDSGEYDDIINRYGHPIINSSKSIVFTVQPDSESNDAVDKLCHDLNEREGIDANSENKEIINFEMTGCFYSDGVYNFVFTDEK